MDAISNRSLKARVGAMAVSLVMATAIATPALAFADGTTSQSTDVTIQSVTPDPDGDNLSFSVPTQIPSSPRQTARCWPLCGYPADPEQVGLPDTRGEYGRHRSVAVQARR